MHEEKEIGKKIMNDYFPETLDEVMTIFFKKIGEKTDLNSYYTKKVYIDILEYILSREEERNTFLNSWHVLKNNHLIFKLNYSEFIADKAEKDLKDAGYIKKSENGAVLSITGSGKKFLRDFHRFKLRSNLEKITIISNKTLPFFFSFAALIISLMALCHHL